MVAAGDGYSFNGEQGDRARETAITRLRAQRQPRQCYVYGVAYRWVLVLSARDRASATTQLADVFLEFSAMEGPYPAHDRVSRLRRYMASAPRGEYWLHALLAQAG